MSIELLAAAVAALGAMAASAGEAIAPAEIEADGAAPKFLVTLAAAAAAVAVSEDAEEPLEIHPLHFTTWRAAPRDAGAPHFKLGGMGLSVVAFKPKSGAELPALRDFRSDARAMGKFMPGYPQPARVVVGLKVSF